MAVQRYSASQKVFPGRTPVVALDLDVAGVHRRIWLKLECHNPHGSLKDRTAATLWESVREQAHPAEGIIESTSGNLGVALAARCAEHSVPFTAVVEPRTSPTSIDTMRRYGARVVMIDRADSRGGYLLNRLAYVREQIRMRPKLVWTNQYENIANPRAHLEHTAPELWDQLRHPATVLLAVSTGGTLAGFRQFARLQGIPWTVVGVDVEGSLALADDIPGKRVLAGIGSSQRSAFAQSAAAPRIIVSAGEAVVACLWVLDETGIALGGSSGALIAAALRWFHLNPHDNADIAVVCPDGGDRYQSTVYSTVWRKENIAARSLTPNVRVLQVHGGVREASGIR
jgi:N-(2-amino-2-carboxyethyl)-L-glutamate synthase